MGRTKKGTLPTMWNKLSNKTENADAFRIVEGDRRLLCLEASGRYCRAPLLWESESLVVSVPALHLDDAFLLIPAKLGQSEAVIT